MSSVKWLPADEEIIEEMTYYIYAILGIFILIFLIRFIRKRVQHAYERSKGVIWRRGMSPGEEGEYYAAKQLCRLDDSKYFIINNFINIFS